MPCTTTSRGSGAGSYARDRMARVSAFLPGGGDDRVRRAAPAVGEEQFLAGAEPLHGGGVPPLRAVEHELVARGERVDEEEWSAQALSAR